MVPAEEALIEAKPSLILFRSALSKAVEWETRGRLSSESRLKAL
jgi:hypothetical protein